MCQYVPYVASDGATTESTMTVHAALAKVAGFDTAVFGVHSSDAPLPLLTQPKGHSGLMMSALRLSSVVSSRFSPARTWARLWRAILRWVHASNSTSWTDRLTFEPRIRPMFTAQAHLPHRATATAVLAGMRWLHTTSKLLVTPTADVAARALLRGGIINGGPPGWPAQLPLFGRNDTGEGSLGVFEAYLSAIDAETGGQGIGVRVRTDCVAQSAGALALGAWPAHQDAKATRTSSALLDFLFAPASQHSDPRSSIGGILRWGTNVEAVPSGDELYSDDQYRSLLSASFAASSLGSSRWNEPLAKLLIGNARLCGPLGYTQFSGGSSALVVEHGWKFYFNDPYVSELQYYQAAARAGNLWGYAISGNASLFLDRTVAGINASMRAFYARSWRCQVGLTSELARMLLPLAWLVRVRDGEQPRKWLRDVATLYLRYMQPSGVIREDPFGFNGSDCGHQPPTSNAAYGTSESTLSQNRTDAVADLMYSANFGLLGLHEAAAAVGAGADHMMYSTAAGKMADFSLRVQVAGERENATPESHLAGSWLRAFDFEAWDYFASGSDTGWGPWVAETGHGISLLLITLAARAQSTSMWEVLTQEPWSSTLGAAVRDLIPAFMDGSERSARAPHSHDDTLLQTISKEAAANDIDVTAMETTPPGFLPPNTRATRWTSNMVLCYVDARTDDMFTWSQRKFERLVALHDAPADQGGGRPIDTLFDSFLILGYNWYNGTSFCPGVGKAPGMDQHDWLAYLRMQLATVGQLAAAAANVSQHLPLPGGATSCTALRPSVVLMVPCPDPRQEHFGEVEGRHLNLSRLDDRIAAVNWWVGEALSQWAAAGLEGVTLTGFYWFHEAIDPGDEVLLPALRSRIHSLDATLSLCWIPYYTSTSFPWLAKWRSLGFDYVMLQPNYAFHNTSLKRFEEVRHLAETDEIGVELELASYVRNPQAGGWRTSFAAYIEHISKWQGSIMRAYYNGNTFVNVFASNSSDFAYYQQLYSFVKGRISNSTYGM